jgi:HSP20 family protein
MLSLMPWRREKKEGLLGPRYETPLGVMRREFATLFDRFFGGLPGPFEPFYEPPVYWGIDVVEDELEFVVKFEVPGFMPEEIEVLVLGDVLKVKAVHKEEVKGKTKVEEPIERKLEKSFTLPPDVDKGKIEACYRNGILEVHMPKVPEAKPQRIMVKP